MRCWRCSSLQPGRARPGRGRPSRGPAVPGPPAGGDHLARLLGQAHAGRQQPGPGHGRLRDHGRRDLHLQRQDGDPHGEPHDGRAGTPDPHR